VSGFWHGANWTFIVWGALHGFYLIFAIISKPVRDRLNKLSGITRIPWLFTITQILITYCLVTFAWIFFRANNIRDAFYIAGRMPAALLDLGRLTIGGHYGMNTFLAAIGAVPIYQTDLILCFVSIFFLEGVHLFQRHHNLLAIVNSRPAYQRWLLYYLMLILIIFFGVYENRQFIYFQF
jgi:hypothetical protein